MVDSVVDSLLKFRKFVLCWTNLHTLWTIKSNSMMTLWLCDSVLRSSRSLARRIEDEQRRCFLEVEEKMSEELKYYEIVYQRDRDYNFLFFIFFIDANNHHLPKWHNSGHNNIDRLVSTLSNYFRNRQLYQLFYAINVLLHNTHQAIWSRNSVAFIYLWT